MSHGLKLLLMAAGAIITCIVVVVGFQLTKSGKNDTNKASEQYTTVSSEYDDVKLSAYDGVTVSGSDVISCINENDTLLKSTTYSFSIVVKTIEDTTGETYTGETYPTPFEKNTSVANSTTSTYINPKGKFKGEITRNDNGVITKITFTQQK